MWLSLPRPVCGTLHTTRFRLCRALYSKQIGALLGGGAGKNLPNMRNLAMELRKLCCHPVRVRVCACGGGGVQSLLPLVLPIICAVTW